MPKRIPAKTKQRVLARDGFQCVGCGSEGGLVIRSACECDSCDFSVPAYDGNLYAVCKSCRDGLRRGLSGAIRLTAKLQPAWKPDLLHRQDRALASPPRPDGTRSSGSQIAEIRHAPKLDTSAAQEPAMSVHQQRKQRHIEREDRKQRIPLKLLAGVPTKEIVAEEGVSRQTVWRHRRRLRQLVPAVRQMMREAARRQDWQEARFWRHCLTTVGAAIEASRKPRDAVMKAWRKRLEAFRDEHLRRESPAALAEEEARPDPSAAMREIEGLTLGELEERRREAITEERDLIDALRQMADMATYEAGIDHTKIGRHNFLSALRYTIVLNAWRREVQRVAGAAAQIRPRGKRRRR